mmetsp:Transcript_35416/g.63936  ORF Transcript_35416/g.63936 Transcript_35416/m.63936 type:complete len:84 (-) Transcript_35416:588-839(-)
MIRVRFRVRKVALPKLSRRLRNKSNKNDYYNKYKKYNMNSNKWALRECLAAFCALPTLSCSSPRPLRPQFQPGASRMVCRSSA